MTDFKLPDLGEGLPDAEIVKWHVAEGDTIEEGDLMVEMSTAKAVVEVPSPYTGKVIKFAGEPGDVVNTGDVLITFQLEGEDAPSVVESVSATASATASASATGSATATASSSATFSNDAAPRGDVQVFNLPDLGEGLPDAEIVKWHVKVGDSVTGDDLMVEMSTAKAVVEVPVPFVGVVSKLHGEPGDVIETGKPLIEISPAGTDVSSDSSVTSVASSSDNATASAKASNNAVSVSASSTDGASESNQVFKLPDLGEGLPDAEIVKWHVKVGDDVTGDDLMVEMSTAKAVVEVPIPFAGKVAKLYGEPGDTINTGSPLIEITGVGGSVSSSASTPAKEESKSDGGREGGDAGTVVGAVVVGNEVKAESSSSKDGINANSAVRAMARKMKVNLAAVKGTGPDGAITMGDVRTAAATGSAVASEGAIAAPKTTVTQTKLPDDIKVAPSAKKMATAMGIDLVLALPSDGRKTILNGDVMRAAAAAIQSGNGAGATSSASAEQQNARAKNVSIADGKGVKATPKVRATAKELGIDIRRVKPTGHADNVTLDDINNALKTDFAISDAEMGAGDYQMPERAYAISGEAEKLVGPRRFMAQAMAKANTEVCHTSIFDEANIGAWPKGTDITVRTMRAIIAACMVEPAMNAHFDGETMSKTIKPQVNLGVAVDSPKGLFVPVLKGAEHMEGQALRAELNRLRVGIADSTITPKEMSGASITLSNFGMIAGKYATPIVSPPEVAIIGIGGLFQQLVMTDKGIENHRHMPVSLTFDHRACTGGEAARFLAAIIADLELKY